MAAPSVRGAGVGEGVGVFVGVWVLVAVELGLGLVEDGGGSVPPDPPGHGDPAVNCAITATHATIVPAAFRFTATPTHFAGHEADGLTIRTPLVGYVIPAIA